MFEVLGRSAHDRNIYTMGRVSDRVSTIHPSLLEQFSPEVQHGLRSIDSKVGLYEWTLREMASQPFWKRSERREVLRKIVGEVRVSDQLLKAVNLGYMPYEHVQGEFLGVLNDSYHALSFSGELVEPAVELVSKAKFTKLFDAYAVVYTRDEAIEAAKKIRADVRVVGYVSWPRREEIKILPLGSERLREKYKVSSGAEVQNGVGFLIYDPKASEEFLEPRRTQLPWNIRRDIEDL